MCHLRMGCQPNIGFGSESCVTTKPCRLTQQCRIVRLTAMFTCACGKALRVIPDLAAAGVRWN
jgi:hypothetical protein